MYEDEEESGKPASALPSVPSPQAYASLQDIFGPPDGTSIYAQVKHIGSGNFGSAWVAEERATKEIVAIKVMDTNNMSVKDRGFVTNEVRCLERCSHPNIVRHRAHFERDGLIVIAMEYADGGDLNRQIKARTPLGQHFRETEVIFIFAQLALALNHIHSKKMMHRDLKSANVLLTTTGMVKLGDFGFSRQYEDSLSNPVGNTFCGTPYYLAPELWRRAPYSNKAEIWALGVVLYEVMALRRPFAGRSMDELIDNILHGRRQPLTATARYSSELIQIVDQLLSPDPAQRPSMRRLFAMPFFSRALGTLSTNLGDPSVLIPDEAKQELLAEIAKALESATEEEAPHPAPCDGAAFLYVEGDGWKACDLALTPTTFSMTVQGGPTETIELTSLTSVCPIDPSIATERYVFAIKITTGRAFWLRGKDPEGCEGWLRALQVAMPY